MDPPVAAEVEITPEKVEETKGISRSYHCGLCDTEVVRKIAQELLPGLASACVDNTTGGIFKSAGSIAVEMRKEMVDYLTQRSETFVAEFILSENAPLQEVSEHPFDIITGLIDDFAGSKRNVFSRVSEWVLSDRRDDKIDDFVQEMEINGFWLLSPRESIASMLVKNVDYKNIFHCDVICSSEEELDEHRSKCKFRPMDCTSEGCTTRYSVVQKENHEGVCLFMILPCEQKCPDFVMRRDMDRHCITVCPMRLVNCAFNTVGCRSTVPWCTVQKHNVDDLPSHLLYILRSAHKDATAEDLKHRVEQIQNLSNTEKLARARDARSLTFLIKDVEAKLGPLGVEVKPNISDSKEIYTIEEGEESAESPSSERSSKKGSPTKPDSPSTTEKPAMVKVSSDQEQQKSTLESTAEKPAESPVKAEESRDKRESSSSSIEEEDQRSQSSTREAPEESPHIEEQESSKSPKEEKVKESSSSDEEKSTKSPKKEKVKDSSRKDEEEESTKSPKEVKESSSSDEEESTKSPKKETVKESSNGDEEESTTSPKGKVKESYSSDEEAESTKSPKEKVKESSSGDEQQSTKSPEMEIVSVSSNGDKETSTESPIGKVKESSSSDEEAESTKSPKEKVKESSSGDEQESKKSPEKEIVRESSNGDKETSTESPIEKVKESSSGDEEESTKSPKKETVEESSNGGDEESSTKSPKTETVKESSSGDEEESTQSPSNTES